MKDELSAIQKEVAAMRSDDRVKGTPEVPSEWVLNTTSKYLHRVEFRDESYDIPLGSWSTCMVWVEFRDEPLRAGWDC
eukprot:6490444-Amphidinium_carterae.1